MQPKTYQLMKKQIKDKADHQNWAQIDSNLKEIPTGFYSFQPKQQNAVYYRRLLTLLNMEHQVQQSLHLSAYILCLNTNNYYALMLHSEAFKQGLQKQRPKQQIQRIICDQLYFTSCILNSNPKQYQIWNYKKDILTWITEYSLNVCIREIIEEEEEFVFYLMTNDDERNYHAWDYMTFIASMSGDLGEKIMETDSKIFIDIENDGVKCQSLWADCYSCWSYRFHLINNLNAEIRKKYLKQECNKVLKFIYNKRESECAWNYLEGIYDHSDVQQSSKEQIISKVKEIISDKQSINNRFAYQFLLEHGNQQQKANLLEKLIQIDSIRKDYYQYLKQGKFK